MTPGLALAQAQAILDAANDRPACVLWEGCEKGAGHDGACRRRARAIVAGKPVYGMSREDWDRYGRTT